MKKINLLNLLSFVKQRKISLQAINQLSHGHKVKCNDPKLTYAGKIKFYSPRSSVFSLSNCCGEVYDL